MSDILNTTQKHMGLNDRIVIEKGLDSSRSLRSIAIELSRDPSTIAKEIKKHRIFQSHNPFNTRKNTCTKLKDCHRKHVCGLSGINCSRECRNCNQCTRHCPDYEPHNHQCIKTTKAPYVCNGCSKKTGCRFDKYYYRASSANREYRSVLVESRTGINISKDDLALLDETVSPLIRQGQSVYMILNNHPEISQCEKTIYNYIESGALSVKNMDLPRKVKYKIRKQHNKNADDSGIFEGRTFHDLLGFLRQNVDASIVEMDSVEGPKENNRQALFTMMFNSCSLQMAYLVRPKHQQDIIDIFDRMEEALGTFRFCQTFQIGLCDRGVEFRNPDALECGINGIIRTNIYFCDPQASWQKPHCEKNHEYIRMICPQTKSTFDNLTQEDVCLMMSHINSACRESLGGLTPFYLAKLMLPKRLLDFFGLREIPKDEVMLTPKLLKGKQLVKRAK